MFVAVSEGERLVKVLIEFVRQKGERQACRAFKH